MPEVLLDGPCAGMTTQEYEEMRALDCRVAIGMGWVIEVRGDNGDEIDCWAPGHYLRYPPVYRDQASGGIPFYSLDMNGAHEVLNAVALNWNYRAKEKFFEQLQKRASYDMATDTMPSYPDCLVSLAVELHKHICHAFADAYNYEVARGLNPFEKSKVATEFVDAQIERREFTETDADGVEHKRFSPKPASAPWVKKVLTVPDDYDVTACENHAEVQAADRVVTESGKVLKKGKGLC